MGNFVPIHVSSKGPILYYLDEMSRKPDARILMEKLAEALHESEKRYFKDMIEVLEKYLFTPMGLVDFGKVSKYLRDFWFDPASRITYFPSYQPLAPLFVAGVLETINLSLRSKGQPTPTDSWWIVDHVDIKLVNLVSPQQITLLFLTPRPPGAYSMSIWSEAAEAYTTARIGIETRMFDNTTP